MNTKFWLILAIFLVISGAALFAGIMTMLGWDFTKLTTTAYVTNQHTITEDFTNISIVVDTSKIQFLPSQDGTCSIICYEQERVTHSVAVRDGTLVIETQDTRKWYEYIGIHFSKPKITIYLPMGQYGELAIRTCTGNVSITQPYTFTNVHITLSTGNIQISDVSADTMALSVSTGDIHATNLHHLDGMNVFVATGDSILENISCRHFASGGGTGDVSMRNVIASGTMTVTRATGDITFFACDAGEILIEADTGDVSGTVLSDKIFFAHTNTGRVEVPKTTTGGKCEITTSTGNIQIRIHH